MPFAVSRAAKLHLAANLSFLLSYTGTLLFGDIVTGPHAVFFHSYPVYPSPRSFSVYSSYYISSLDSFFIHIISLHLSTCNVTTFKLSSLYIMCPQSGCYIQPLLVVGIPHR